MPDHLPYPIWVGVRACLMTRGGPGAVAVQADDAVTGNPRRSCAGFEKRSGMRELNASPARKTSSIWLF